MDVIHLYQRAAGSFVATLEAVGAHWGAPTPCSDWDVRELVNHVVGEDLWTVALMGGATIDEVGNRLDGDVLGDDPVATARVAADAATAATASGVAARRMVHLSHGDTPAEEYAHQLAADHLVHGWDLAAGIGADRTLDPELVEAVAAWFTEREDLYRDAGAIAARPDETPVGAQDRLLCAFGRRPDWMPPAGHRAG
jgi:uncharacterized protein (TIGR03086 family)